MLLVFCNFHFFKLSISLLTEKKHTALVVKTVFAKVVIFKHHHVMYDIKMTKYTKKKMMNVLIESKSHYPILIQIQLKTTYLNKSFFKIIFFFKSHYCIHKNVSPVWYALFNHKHILNIFEFFCSYN